MKLTQLGRITAILLSHEVRPDGVCRCGWGSNGLPIGEGEIQLHAEHVAEQIAANLDGHQARQALEAAARIDTAFSHGVPCGSDDPVTERDWQIVLDYARSGGAS